MANCLIDDVTLNGMVASTEVLPTLTRSLAKGATLYDQVRQARDAPGGPPALFASQQGREGPHPARVSGHDELALQVCYPAVGPRCSSAARWPPSGSPHLHPGSGLRTDRSLGYLRPRLFATTPSLPARYPGDPGTSPRIGAARRHQRAAPAREPGHGGPAVEADSRLIRQRGLSTTKPGTLLKKAIPVRTFANWDDAQPSFLELDLVAHCGDSISGEYIRTLDTADVSTGWSECVAVPNRGQLTVFGALQVVRQWLPFPLCGIDSDNDSALINDDLHR